VLCADSERRWTKRRSNPRHRHQHQQHFGQAASSQGQLCE
jgi:hypothetical protein